MQLGGIQGGHSAAEARRTPITSSCAGWRGYREAKPPPWSWGSRGHGQWPPGADEGTIGEDPRKETAPVGTTTREAWPTEKASPNHRHGQWPPGVGDGGIEEDPRQETTEVGTTT